MLLSSMNAGEKKIKSHILSDHQRNPSNKIIKGWKKNEKKKRLCQKDEFNKDSLY